MAMKDNQQLAALLLYIIQNSNMIPFRWSMGKYMCCYCPSKFRSSTALKEHNSKGHDEINISEIITRKTQGERGIKLDVAGARCNQCDQKILDISDYIEHVLEKHNAEFNSELAKHFVSYRLSDEDMSCIECGQHFRYFGQLLIHTNKLHVGKRICEVCGQGFAGKVNFQNHMNRMHSAKVCKHCNEIFSTQYALFEHVASKHRTVLKCDICDEIQQNHYHLKRHKALVHNCKDLQIVCEFCSKVFTRNNKYVEHKERVHFKLKKITCDVCGYSAYDAKSVSVHRVCHGDDMPYSCPCGKTFRRSNNFEVHKRNCQCSTDDATEPSIQP